MLNEYIFRGFKESYDKRLRFVHLLVYVHTFLGCMISYLTYVQEARLHFIIYFDKRTNHLVTKNIGVPGVVIFRN